MNFKQFYEEVSKKSGYDKELIRIVWNSFWYSARANTKDNIMIDIDNFGLMHVSPIKIERYVNHVEDPKPVFTKMYDMVKENKSLTKYLKNEGQSNISRHSEGSRNSETEGDSDVS